MSKVTKGRYWVGVCYPENMCNDWKEVIGDLLEFPYCFCIHDKDHLAKYQAKRKADQERQRKVHVHVIIAFPNTTTENHALECLNKLSKDRATCCPGVQQVMSIRTKYEYLIHDTETCKKQGKYLYSASERISGNNFDIGSYEQVSTADKQRMRKELADFIINEQFTNFADFYQSAITNFSNEYFEIISTYSGFYERLTRGIYQRYKHELEIGYERVKAHAERGLRG